MTSNRFSLCNHEVSTLILTSHSLPIEDLHPGNVIFREYGPDAPSSSSSSSSSLLRGESDGSSSAQWELSFIDAGLVATLNKSDRRNFIDLFAAVVKNDGRRVGELMIERSRGGGVKCVNREGFIVAISELVNTVTKSGTTDKSFYLTHYI